MSKAIQLERLALLIAVSGAALTLTLKGWSGAALVLSGLLSTYVIFFSSTASLQTQPPLSTSEKWLFFTFTFPLAGTLISAALRQDFHSAQFDTPARFLLAWAVYLCARGTAYNVLPWIYTAISAGAVLAAAYVLIDEFSMQGTRARTYFMDSIMLGYISLTLGILSFHATLFGQIKNKPLLWFTAIGGVCGVAVSLSTQSRTGWLALPVVLVIFSFQALIFRSAPVSRMKLAAISACFVAIVITFLPVVSQRIGDAYREYSEYSFDGIAPDTSNGMRLTYWRIGIDLIAERPLQGYGDTAKTPPQLPEEAEYYASQTVKDEVFFVGFHNELIATTVRSGLLGGAYVILIFLVPLVAFARHLRDAALGRSQAAGMGACLVSIVGASSLTIETFGLRFAVSFYALLVVLLLSQTLKIRSSVSDA